MGERGRKEGRESSKAIWCKGKREREFEASGRFGPRWDMSRAGESPGTFCVGASRIFSLL